jgi:hypothetical protein
VTWGIIFSSCLAIHITIWHFGGMSAPKVIILPGNGCTPIEGQVMSLFGFYSVFTVDSCVDSNWYAWVRDELVAAGVNAVMKVSLASALPLTRGAYRFAWL